MNSIDQKLLDAAAKKQAKLDDKKREIAASTLNVLRELGYANTSLRDIANRSSLSLGSLHYYFKDKTELIGYCVREYKREFVGRIGRVLTESRDEEVLRSFSAALARSIARDSATHKLWYDIRVQGMFNESFRVIVEEYDEKLVKLIDDLILRLGAALDAKLAYAVLDGLFFRFVCESAYGHQIAESEMAELFLNTMLKLAKA